MGNQQLSSLDEVYQTTYINNRNAAGIPLFEQTGQQAIKNFEALIEALSPELRAAYTHERALMLAELATLRAQKR